MTLARIGESGDRSAVVNGEITSYPAHVDPILRWARQMETPMYVLV